MTVPVSENRQPSNLRVIAHACGLAGKAPKKRRQTLFEKHLTDKIETARREKSTKDQNLAASYASWPVQRASIEKTVNNYYSGASTPESAKALSVKDATTYVVAKHSKPATKGLPENWQDLPIEALAKALNVNLNQIQEAKPNDDRGRGRRPSKKQKIALELSIPAAELHHVQQKYFGVWTAFRHSHRKRSEVITCERFLISEGQSGQNLVLRLKEHEGQIRNGHVIISKEHILMVFAGVESDEISHSTGVMVLRRNVITNDGAFKLTLGYRIRHANLDQFVAYKTIFLRQPDRDEDASKGGLESLPPYTAGYGPGSYLYQRLKPLLDPPKSDGMSHIGNLQFLAPIDFKDALADFDNNENQWSQIVK